MVGSHEIINFEKTLFPSSTKSSASLDTITLFQLHEGALVNIVGKHDDWLEVRLNDNQKGWVPQNSLGT